MKEGIAGLVLAMFSGGLGAAYNPNPLENPWWLLCVLASAIATARIIYSRRKATHSARLQTRGYKIQSD